MMTCADTGCDWLKLKRLIALTPSPSPMLLRVHLPLKSSTLTSNCQFSVKLHLRERRADGRTVCPSVRPSLRWSLTLIVFSVFGVLSQRGQKEGV